MDDDFIQRKMDEIPIISILHLNLELSFQLSIRFINYLYDTRHYLDIYRNNKTIIIEYNGIYYKIGDYLNLRQVLNEININVENINVDDINVNYLDKTIDKINKIKLDITFVLNEYTTF